MINASRQIVDLLRRFELASRRSRIPFRAACVVHALKGSGRRSGTPSHRSAVSVRGYFPEDPGLDQGPHRRLGDGQTELFW
jgi:hypothetical protein